MRNRLAHLQSLQLERDRSAEPEFWFLPTTRRFQRLGLRLTVLLPSVLRYSELDGEARQECLLRLTQLTLACANTLGMSMDRFEEIEIGDPDAFAVSVASAVGNIADAGEKIDHLEEFGPLARKATTELMSVIASRALVDGVNLDALIEVAAAVPSLCRTGRIRD